MDNRSEKLTRRDMLSRSTFGFGQIALAGILAERSTAAETVAPKTVRRAHFVPRAKRVLLLFLTGGPSHVDLWDWKPELARRSGEPLPFPLPDNDMTFGVDNSKLLGPLAKFRPCGESGLFFSDLIPNLAGCADELCVLNGMYADNSAHQPARRQMFTGVPLHGKPSIGAWVSYGLGTENQNLPSFIALGGPSFERASAFLPAEHQGTKLSPPSSGLKGNPIRHLTDRSMSASDKRRQLDFIQSLNRSAARNTAGDEQMEGMIRAMELAFRMQVEASSLADFTRESTAILKRYGVDQEPTNRAARQCLLARRCLEAGVRFVSVTLSSWDHHGDIANSHPQSCHAVDRPIAGLLTDLKMRGLLDETLVVCTGEFGRTPYFQDDPRRVGRPGREHNRYGFTTWLAGGGVKAGYRHGGTDEFGAGAVDGRVHIHDLHATILHLLGLAHERLTYRHVGRDFRLTDVHGRVVHEILS
ncbi:MAG: DUF1501 domain-containing protein [Fuerstiella sp.]|nr:DUF1501 domain-containing protein [Fuerstiella sp.]